MAALPVVCDVDGGDVDREGAGEESGRPEVEKRCAWTPAADRRGWRWEKISTQRASR